MRLSITKEQVSNWPGQSREANDKKFWKKNNKMQVVLSSVPNNSLVSCNDS